jgi:poly(ADP-ribose) glycohydrolase ARH3
MTLGLAESLVAGGGFDGAQMAAQFAQNYAAEPWRGYGAEPLHVFRRIAEGVPWDHAGRMLFGGFGSFGNGAAMRVAPAALLAFRDLEQVVWLAWHTAIITHDHELGVEGAILQARAVALLIQHPPAVAIDTTEFLAALRPMSPTTNCPHSMTCVAPWCRPARRSILLYAPSRPGLSCTATTNWPFSHGLNSSA